MVRLALAYGLRLFIVVVCVSYKVARFRNYNASSAEDKVRGHHVCFTPVLLNAECCILVPFLSDFIHKLPSSTLQVNTVDCQTWQRQLPLQQ